MPTPTVLLSVFDGQSHSQCQLSNLPAVLELADGCDVDDLSVVVQERTSTPPEVRIETRDRSRIGLRLVVRWDARQRSVFIDESTAGETRELTAQWAGDAVVHESRAYLRLGETYIAVSVLPALPVDVIPLRTLNDFFNTDVSAQMAEGQSPAPETLEQWLSALGSIQRQAAFTAEFHQAAVRAIVEPGGLDAGMYLQRVDDRWQISHSCVPRPPAGVAFDPRIVEQALTLRSPVFHAHSNTKCTASDDVLAAPVFNERADVLGVLYACRRLGPSNRRQGIRQLEARWIQLIAEAMTSGVIRCQREAQATRQQLLLQQAFPPRIVQQIVDSELSLVSEEREVTVMFADLMDSSQINEKLSPKEVHEFLADVFDQMTMAVQSEGGTIIDYFGDGMVAMWNAPIDQPDHARRAVSSGIGLGEACEHLDVKWRSRVGQPVRLGIGVHTGRAIVGNSGSRLRLKYGPRGLTVHIASRVERATRHLHVPFLISDATYRELHHETAAGRSDPDEQVRPVRSWRLGSFQLRGIDEPLVLHAVRPTRVDNPNDDAEEMVSYAQILRQLECGDIVGAVNELDSLSDQPAEAACLAFLRSQIEAVHDWHDDGAGHGDAEFRVVFDLTFET